jgi:hypothetical protein
VWGFFAGDDWVVAVGVVIVLALTALVATTTLPAWWITPVGALALLWGSLRRAARSGPGNG